jgi:large subunit ribosomal protein L7/L12
MKKDTICCEICGAEMRFEKDEHSVCWICDNCNNAVATSYFEPILLDNTNYHIILISNNCSVCIIKMVSEISGYNYIETKKAIENAPVEIFSGKAVDIKPVKENLEKAGVNFSIEPEFLY